MDDTGETNLLLQTTQDYLAKETAREKQKKRRAARTEEQIALENENRGCTAM